jgi:hypothetical protein
MLISAHFWYPVLSKQERYRIVLAGYIHDTLSNKLLVNRMYFILHILHMLSTVNSRPKTITCKIPIHVLIVVSWYFPLWYRPESTQRAYSIANSPKIWLHNTIEVMGQLKAIPNKKKK